MRMTTKELMKLKEDTELVVFWQEIASYLPTSPERSALGDIKIFAAFKGAYPKIKNYLLLTFIDSEIERKKGMKKEMDMDGNIPRFRDGVDMWGDDCADKINDRNFSYNQAIDDDISYLKKLKEELSNQL